MKNKLIFVSQVAKKSAGEMHYWNPLLGTNNNNG